MNQHLARAQVEISKNGGREKQWEDWDFLLLSLRLFFQRLLLWLLCKIKRREWDGNWELKTYLIDEDSCKKLINEMNILWGLSHSMVHQHIYLCWHNLRAFLDVTQTKDFIQSCSDLSSFFFKPKESRLHHSQSKFKHRKIDWFYSLVAELSINSKYFTVAPKHP